MSYIQLPIADYNCLKDAERFLEEIKSHERKPVLYVYHGSKPDRTLKYQTENEVLKDALVKNEVLARRNEMLDKLHKAERFKCFISGVLVASGVVAILSSVLLGVS